MIGFIMRILFSKSRLGAFCIQYKLLQLIQNLQFRVLKDVSAVILALIFDFATVYNCYIIVISNIKSVPIGRNGKAEE